MATYAQLKSPSSVGTLDPSPTPLELSETVPRIFAEERARQAEVRRLAALTAASLAAVRGDAEKLITLKETWPLPIVYSIDYDKNPTAWLGAYPAGLIVLNADGTVRLTVNNAGTSVASAITSASNEILKYIADARNAAERATRG